MQNRNFWSRLRWPSELRGGRRARPPELELLWRTPDPDFKGGLLLWRVVFGRTGKDAGHRRCGVAAQNKNSQSCKGCDSLDGVA